MGTSDQPDAGPRRFAARDALGLIDTWPVPRVAAAIVDGDGVRITHGDTGHSFRLASLSKSMTAWAIMIAVEEGVADLDEVIEVAPTTMPDIVVNEGMTLRHLLAHAAGYPFDGPKPVAAVERRRIYSNTGIEIAAAVVADSAAMRFETYLNEAVFAPLGMSSTLVGSPAFGVHATVDDVASFLAEMQRPALIARSTCTTIESVQYPSLAGIVPGVGRFDPCPWGLGVEIRGEKWPHWTGRANSPATFGHFGGAGTMMWVDPTARVGATALTDRPFDQWSVDAMRLWPEFSDAVLTAQGAGR